MKENDILVIATPANGAVVVRGRRFLVELVAQFPRGIGTCRGVYEMRESHQHTWAPCDQDTLVRADPAENPFPVMESDTYFSIQLLPVASGNFYLRATVTNDDTYEVVARTDPVMVRVLVAEPSPETV